MAAKKVIGTFGASGPETGWPRGPHITYECPKCGGVIPSDPDQSEELVACPCGNIEIDVDAGRFGVLDPQSRVKVLEED